MFGTISPKDEMFVIDNNLPSIIAANPSNEYNASEF